MGQETTEPIQLQTESLVEEVRVLKPYMGEITLDTSITALCLLPLASGYVYAHHTDTSDKRSTEDKELAQLVWNKLDRVGEGRRMSRKNVVAEHLIAEGSYGRVFCGTVGGQKVAIKEYNRKDVRGFRSSTILKERDILIYLKNKRIVNIVGAFQESGGTFVLLELCYGSVDHFLPRFETCHKLRFTRQYLEGIEWMHSKNIIHLDLRPSNCLVTHGNNLVISDFGTAEKLNHGEEKVKSECRISCAGYSDEDGNLNYTYSKMSDIFSAACTIFMMWTGRNLMKYGTDGERGIMVDAEEYIRVVNEGRFSNFISLAEGVDNGSRIPLLTRARKLCSPVAPLIEIMILPTATRATASNVLSHPQLAALLWSAGINEENLDNDTRYVTTQGTKMTQVEMRPPNFNRARVDLPMQIMYYDEQDERYDSILSTPIHETAHEKEEGNAQQKDDAAAAVFKHPPVTITSPTTSQIKLAIRSIESGDIAQLQEMKILVVVPLEAEKSAPNVAVTETLPSSEKEDNQDSDLAKSTPNLTDEVGEVKETNLLPKKIKQITSGGAKSRILPKALVFPEEKEVFKVPKMPAPSPASAPPPSHPSTSITSISSVPSKAPAKRIGKNLRNKSPPPNNQGMVKAAVDTARKNPNQEKRDACKKKLLEDKTEEKTAKANDAIYSSSDSGSNSGSDEKVGEQISARVTRGNRKASGKDVKALSKRKPASTTSGSRQKRDAESDTEDEDTSVKVKAPPVKKAKVDVGRKKFGKKTAAKSIPVKSMNQQGKGESSAASNTGEAKANSNQIEKIQKYRCKYCKEGYVGELAAVKRHQLNCPKRNRK